MLTVKNLVKEAIIYSFMGLLPKLLGLLLIPLLTRRFTQGENGIIDLTIALSAFLVMLLNMGMDSSLVRSINPLPGTHSREEHFSTVFWFRLVIYSISLAIIIYYASSISVLLYKNDQFSNVVIWSMVSIISGSIWMLFLQLYRLQLKSSDFFILSVVNLILTWSLSVYMVGVKHGGIQDIFKSSALVDVFLIIILIYLNRQSLFSPVINLLGKLIRSGLTLLPAALLLYLLQYVDRFFIQRYLGFDQLGIYAIGFRITVVVSLVITGFESVWLPFLWSAYQQSNGNTLIETVYKIFTMSLAVIALFIGIFSHEILGVLGTNEYKEAANFIFIMVIALAIYYSTHYFCIGLEISNKTFHRMVGGFLAAFASVFLNIVFIPKYGIVGAAWASLISCLIYGLYVISVSQKLYHMEYDLSRYFSMMAVFLICGYLVTWITTISFSVILIKLLILVMVGLLTPLILKFISWEDLARVILNIRKMTRE